jgi:coatomer subunit beta'
MRAASDVGGLLLLASCRGSDGSMRAVADEALAKKRFNIAFIAFLLTQQLERCVDVLVAAGRLPEAAFFARTYLPSCAHPPPCFTLKRRRANRRALAG